MATETVEDGKWCACEVVCEGEKEKGRRDVVGENGEKNGVGWKEEKWVWSAIL